MPRLILFYLFLCAPLLLSAQSMTFTNYNVNDIGHSDAFNFTTVNGKLFFIASNNVSGYEPWISDGTVAGTIMLSETVRGNQHGVVQTSVAELNGRVYFIVFDDYHYQMWTSDGTTPNTKKLMDISPDVHNMSYTCEKPITCNGQVFYKGLDADYKSSLYATDGTEAGTKKIVEINFPTSAAYNQSFKVFKDKLFFVNEDSSHGRELWVSDGTGIGTQMVKDINPGTAGSNVIGLFDAGNIMYFRAYDAINGYELWKTDGTSAGTVLIKDMNAGIGSGALSGPEVMLDNKVYFVGDDGSHGGELCVSDGTAIGTYLIKDITPGYIGRGISSITTFNNKLFFSTGSNSSNLDIELWTSDGTEIGTFQLKDIYPGYKASSPSSFMAFEGKLYFTANNDAGKQIWRTDGTEIGTECILNPDNVSNSPVWSGFYKYNDALYFSANYSNNGIDLWSIRNMWNTGLNHVKKNEFSLYPNPNNGAFIIQLENMNFKRGIITIYDILGRICYSSAIIGTRNKISLAEPKGTYVITVQLDNETFTKKILIQ